MPSTSEPVSAFTSPEELDAIELIRKGYGVDVVRTSQFWEAAVARIVAGSTTAHGCAWDVELEYFGPTIRIEVKFSQEFDCQFSNEAAPRPVMKFANPRGEGALAKVGDVTVFVGIDRFDQVWAWAVPSSALPHCRSITVTSPRARLARSSSRSPLRGWGCPPTQLLPEILRIWHRYVEETM